MPSCSSRVGHCVAPQQCGAVGQCLMPYAVPYAPTKEAMNFPCKNPSGCSAPSWCLEKGACPSGYTDWFKSKYSNANGTCVETRMTGDVQVRDSKNPDGPILNFAPEAWRAFISKIT